MPHIKKTYDFLREEAFQNQVKEAYRCLECGRCTGSCPMARIFPEHFNPHHVLEKIIDHPEKAITDKDIWFCATCYSCNPKCPQKIELPYIFHELRKIAIQQYGVKNISDALEIIRQRIPFADSFFRVCYHPERIPLDEETLQGLVERKITKVIDRTVPKSKARVAIIGSGPAGLYAAYHLRHKGYSVTIFESLPKAGGMFRRCIPEYRIPSETVGCDIRRIENNDIEIRTNFTIGKDLEFMDLFKQDYEAVLIAAGAHKCLELYIQGEHLPQVIPSLQFLEILKTGSLSIDQEQLVVIGGGNTSVEIAITATRLGASKVSILYRRSSDEMPADMNEIREAEKMGIQFQYLVTPIRFIGNEKLEAIECLKMELGYPDISGRRRPIPVEDSNFTIEATLAVVAIGELPNASFLPREVKLNPNGTIQVNPITMETTMQGVFAAGDVISGAGTVSEAIRSAGKAVEWIDNYLTSR